MILFSTILLVCTAIGLLGLAGGFATLPFRTDRQFVILLSPMCGLLILPPLVALTYSIFKIPFAQSALLAMTACVGLTIFSSVGWRPSRQELLVSTTLALVVASLATIMFCAATIKAGSQTILYIDGSDHGGYAHMADWLLSHTIDQRPMENPKRPYESWPAVLFSNDLRLSSFVALALMALLNRSSGLFAYDPACAVVFAIACLSIAACFARSRSTLLGLALSLLATTWFELGRDGYFGKLLAYPSCLFLLGLFATSGWRMSAQKLAMLVILTEGVATLHSGLVTAFFLGAIGGALVGFGSGFAQAELRKTSFAQQAMWLAAIVLVALASNGMLARPMYIVPGRPEQFSPSWGRLIPHLLEIQNPTREYVPISEAWLSIGSVAALIFQTALIAFALLKRSSFAVSFTLAPMLVFVLMFALSTLGVSAARYAAYQVTGILVSYSLCGLAWLADDEGVWSKRTDRLAMVIGLSAAIILVRLPRMVVSFKTYVSSPPRLQIFKLPDFDALASAVGDRTLLVDLHDDIRLIAVLVELGRRGTNMQWSHASWNILLGYRNWAPSAYSSTPNFILDDRQGPAKDREGRQNIYEAVQYRLIRVSE